MEKKKKQSLWVQVFLAYKYLNEFLKDGVLKKYKISPYDYFLLMNLRAFENLTFYEINKYMPIDGKSLHNKINHFIDKGLMERDFHENGSSAINLTDKARKIIHDVYVENMDDSTEYFEPMEINKLFSDLYKFNEKMRKILELDLDEESLEKINEELI